MKTKVSKHNIVLCVMVFILCVRWVYVFKTQSKGNDEGFEDEDLDLPTIQHHQRKLKLEYKEEQERKRRQEKELLKQSQQRTTQSPPKVGTPPTVVADTQPKQNHPKAKKSHNKKSANTPPPSGTTLTSMKIVVTDPPPPMGPELTHPPYTEDPEDVVALESIRTTSDGVAGIKVRARQMIESKGAVGWVHVVIKKEHYLVVANQRSESSSVYKYNIVHKKFYLVQLIPSVFAQDVTYFNPHGRQHYLLFANYYQGKSHSVNSTLWYWNGVEFTLHDEVTTEGAYSWEVFRMNKEWYAIVANHMNGKTFQVNSTLYRWDGDNEKFIFFQNILTKGATRWRYYEWKGQSYLTVANHYHDGQTKVNSAVYRWDGRQGAFRLHQEVPTHGAYDWRSMVTNNELMLLLTNTYNQSALYNVDHNGTLQLNQTVGPMQGAHGCHLHYVKRKNLWLAGIAYYFSEHSTHTDSMVYVWSNTTGWLVKAGALSTHGGKAWTFFEMYGTTYAVVSNFLQGFSHPADSSTLIEIQFLN